MRALTLGLLVAALAGCESEPPAQDLAPAGDLGAVRDLRPASPDLPPADMLTPLEFEDFVLGLIDTQTTDTAQPTTTEDKTFVDSMDPAKFAPLFP